MEKVPHIPHMTTLVSRLNSLVSEGYTEDFKITDNGFTSLKTEKVYQPEEVKIVNFYRFEGDSDPSDNTILYAIQTSDGSRGTLVDAYGPYSDSRVTAFMEKVSDISKKVVKEEKLP